MRKPNRKFPVRLTAFFMAMLLSMGCVMPNLAFASEFFSEVYESAEVSDPADYSTDPWDGEGTISIPTPVEDESEPEKSESVQGDKSEQKTPVEGDKSEQETPVEDEQEEAVVVEPDASASEVESAKPEKKPVFQLPILDEDFPDDYESDDYNTPKPNFGIAPMALYDGVVDWSAIPYADGQLSFELNGTTVQGATYKGLSAEKVSENDTYDGDKYRTFTNTAFDNDHTITLPDAGFYIKNGKINRVKVVLQVKVLNDNQGKHGTGAFITTGHPGHFGNADLLANISRGSRDYTYIAIRPYFYYTGTNTQITDYTLVCYLTDIDPATTKNGRNPGIEGWAFNAVNTKTISFGSPTSVKSAATLTQTVDGVAGGSSIDSPAKKYGTSGTNWYYLPKGSDTTSGDNLGVDCVRLSCTKKSGEAAPELWYSADIAHYSRIKGFYNTITYNIINTTAEQNTLKTLNGNKSVTPDTFSVVRYTATNGDTAKAAINDHSNLTKKGWIFSGWYTSQSAVPATWEAAKAKYNTSADNTTVYGGVAKMSSNVQLYGKYYAVPIPTGTLNITKTDAKTGAAMSGVTFTLTSKEAIVTEWGEKLLDAGKQVGTLITDTSGKATLTGIYCGKYILSEVTPSGYFKLENRTVEIPYPADVTSTVKIDMNIQNTPMNPKLVVAKLANKTTGAVLDEATGRYSGTKKAGTYESREPISFKLTGTNMGDVDLFDVTVTEDTSDYAAYLIANSFSYGLAVGDTIKTKMGKTATVTAVSNSGNLYAVKLDKLEKGDSVTLNASCSCIATMRDLENLLNTVKIGGSYDTTDNGVKDSLSPVPETPEMTDIDHFNMKGYGSITLMKYDGTKKPIKGVTFAVKDAAGKIVAEKTTDAAGKAVFEKLPLGDYTVTETKTKAGMTLLTEPVHVTLPVTMTDAEVKVQKADTSKGWYSTVEKRWYFFDVTYAINNTSNFDIPMTGGQPAIVWMFGFMGITCMSCAGLYLYLILRKRI